MSGCSLLGWSCPVHLTECNSYTRASICALRQGDSYLITCLMNQNEEDLDVFGFPRCWAVCALGDKWWSSQLIMADVRGMFVSTQQSSSATWDWKQQPIIPRLWLGGRLALRGALSGCRQLGLSAPLRQVTSEKKATWTTVCCRTTGQIEVWERPCL